jgi:hypothetical protein
MFDRVFKFESDGQDKSFVLDLKIDSDWKTAKRRLLVIQQTVTFQDLEAQELASNDWLERAIKYSRQIARTIDPDVKQFSFATSNFNSRKHLHLKGPAKAEAESEFKARQLRLIKKLDPTHILFCGDLNLLYHIPYAMFKNGWVHEIDGRKVTSTLDFDRLVSKKGALANLLGFWCRHLANLFIGHNPYLQQFQVKPILVDTVEKFDKVMAKFDSSNEIAVDTETRNLSTLRNKIYTIQFAFESDKDRGYVIPIDHPHKDNPFSILERKYMKRELKKRFGARYDLYGKKRLLTFNGAFDLRIIRRALKLKIIYLPVWEIMAGEHGLDENCSSLRSAGVAYGDLGPQGLAAVLCSYGNDFYLDSTSTFTKEDRNTTGSVSPRDEGFLKYCLPPGQLVLTRSGEVPIEQVVPGDEVLSFNHLHKRTEYKLVKDTARHSTRKRLLKINSLDGSVIVTEDHPVWSEDRQEYVEARLLRVGERLVLHRHYVPPAE